MPDDRGRNHSFTLESRGVVIVNVDNQSLKLIN